MKKFAGLSFLQQEPHGVKKNCLREGAACTTHLLDDDNMKIRCTCLDEMKDHSS